MNKEISKETVEVFNKIDWQPVPAAFQLSPNRQWGRHAKIAINGEKELREIVDEIKKHWKLTPYSETDNFYYFTDNFYYFN